MKLKIRKISYRISRICSYMRSFWGVIGSSIYDLIYNLLWRDMVEMWKCRKSFGGSSSHRLSTESMNGPRETWKKLTVLSLLWKNASDNGNFPKTLLAVCNAKYVFKSPEWRNPKATGRKIWPSSPDKNKKFVSAAKMRQNQPPVSMGKGRSFPQVKQET